MPTTTALARRMYDLFEPIHLVTYFTDDPDEELAGLGLRNNYWDGYFASRAGALGLNCPAEVVHAVFYNFAPGEVDRHIPFVWSRTTPAAAFAARQRGAVRAIRRLLGADAESHDLRLAADLTLRAATGAPTEGRPLYAALRALTVPEEPVARLYHAATLLREHRGDGHIAALVTHGIGGLESHVLAALALGLPAEKYGRIHHLPAAQIGRVVDGLRARGIVDAAGGFTVVGRDLKERIERLTDTLAEAPWQALTTAEVEQVQSLLTPVSATIKAALTI